jgi:intraflagellar transport protein 88
MDQGQARPMTSISSANYTRPGTTSSRFDPLGQGRVSGAVLVKKSETSPEAAAREMEKKVNNLMEECCMLRAREDGRGALEKAKETYKKERQLDKWRQSNNITEAMNPDLSYAVQVNLANEYVDPRDCTGDY